VRDGHPYFAEWRWEWLGNGLGGLSPGIGDGAAHLFVYVRIIVTAR
jgi:hypothetical protein